MRILFLTHRLPYAPNRGDRIRAYYLLREMSRFAAVSLFSLVHDDEEAAQREHVPFARDVTCVRVRRVRNLVRGAARLATRRPLTHSLLDAPGAHAALTRLVESTPPDLVVAFCSGMARFALESPLNDRPFVLDMVDVDSAKWAHLARMSRGLYRWVYRREARTLSAFEAIAAKRAEVTLVINERERNTLLQIAPGARVSIVPVGIDFDAFTPPGPPVSSPTVIFCGVMDYYPNEQGVCWFAKQVWPRVRAARPDARFVIVGSGPTRAIRKLAVRDASIEVVGRVPAVQPYLWKSAVSVAPLHVAQGLQTKVFEALAAGLPVVVTAAVWAGLPPEAHQGCLTANDPNDFADAVLKLLRCSAEERRRQAASASLDRLRWSERLRRLEGILREASARHPRYSTGSNS